MKEKPSAITAFVVDALGAGVPGVLTYFWFQLANRNRDNMFSGLAALICATVAAGLGLLVARAVVHTLQATRRETKPWKPQWIALGLLGLLLAAVGVYFLLRSLLPFLRA